jgi:hypothetical protein
LLLFPDSFRIGIWDGGESASKEQYRSRSYNNSGNNNRIADISLFGNREYFPLREYLCEEGDRLGQGNPN